jgi:uncharacterized repeat protein (TIGR04076 family)
MLEIEVVEIRGKCPVYKVGDKIVIDGPSTVLEKDGCTLHARTLSYTTLCRCIR